MALIRYYRLGKNNLDGSALTNDTYYTYSTNNRLSAGYKLTDYMSYEGKDISDELRILDLNEHFNLIYVDENNRLFLEANNIYRDNPTTFGSQVYTIFLLKYKINGNETLMGTITVYFEFTSNGATYKQPTYIYVATDGVSNGYIKIGTMVVHKWTSGKPLENYICPYIATPTTDPMYGEMYNLITKNCKGIDTDPWKDAGYAGIGGGEGTFNFTSDTIALPALPTIDAVSSGFLQLFTGGLNSILDLSRYMWSNNFFDNVVKITSNPIDIIMGLYMYPFIVPATNQKYIRAGNVITNISMGVPDSQILEIDCGNIDIPMFYGAYLDYDPFTKCDLFLPYCGTFHLSMDDIVGKTINVKYRIDLLTGVCGAYVVVGGSVKYNFTGTCAINIPISSRSFENIYNSIMGVVGSMHGGSSFGLPSVGSIAGAVTSGKNQIQHGGVCSGNAGYLGVQNPYLIFSVPNVAIPEGLNTYTGYPIYATYILGDLKGYTEIETIHLENMGTATKEEIDKIISMLEGGVIL